VAVNAIVFDFDGVIIDSEVTNYDAWCETYARYGAELAISEYLASMGGHHVNTYELLTRKATVPVPEEAGVRAAKRARHLELLAGTDVLPGVANWVTEARGMGLPVAIASSADPSWLDENLARVGLATAFDCICCCDGELPPKPAPDLYLRACELLEVVPASALAIEDSPTGLLAARAAGMPTLGVRHRLTLDVDLAADVVVRSLAELTLVELLHRV